MKTKEKGSSLERVNRDITIMKLLACGYNKREISRKINISEAAIGAKARTFKRLENNIDIILRLNDIVIKSDNKNHMVENNEKM